MPPGVRGREVSGDVMPVMAFAVGTAISAYGYRVLNWDLCFTLWDLGFMF